MDDWIILKNEHERIQKKVFTNWINYYVPNCIEKDIITELRDGTKLIALIEALTGHKIQCEKGKKLRRVHFISNVNKVLNYVESKKIKLVNINSTDIVDGNTCIILGLIWTLILRFHIHGYFTAPDISRSDERLKIQSPSLTKSSKLDKNQNEINNTRKFLIDKFNQKFDLNITNFKSDWRDGFNILKMIDKLMPNLNAVQRGRELKTNLERLDLALNLANDYLNVRKLLDPEDIDLNNPDDKSLITYLTQYLQKYPTLDVNHNLEFNQTSPLNQFEKQPPITSQQPTVDPKKLFEESIISHECKLIQDFIDKVYITGINLQNLSIYSNQMNNLEQIYNKTKSNLSFDLISKWNVIKEELEIANQIKNWMKNGEKQMKIPCSYEQCRQQLINHCTNELNLKKQPILINDLVNDYNRCIDDVKKWKIAIEKASQMWQIYEASKTGLINWLQEADQLLLKSHEPKLDKEIRRNYLDNLKNFFSDRDENEKILKQFNDACENVLSTLPDENKPELRSTLTGLMNRFYKIINYSAPQHLIKFEFDFIECDFFDKVRSLKNLNNNQRDQINTENLILNDLQNLENLSTTYWNSFNDKSLLDKAIGHRREWDRYKKRLDENYNLIRETKLNLLKDVQEAEYSVGLAKNNDLKTEILLHNENLFKRIHSRLNELKNLEKANQLDLGNDLREIENQIDRLLLDLNMVVEDKILNWCKVKDRSRLPSPISDNEKNPNNRKFLIQKIDFYSKLVNEFEKYEALIGRSRQLIEELNLKLDELANKQRPIDEIAINYKIYSTTIETSITKILEEIREINNKLREHNYMEELHANEILNELKRLKQRNEEQYSYLIDNFSKDLLKQIEFYRTKCEHCKEIADLRNLLLEVRNLNATSVDKIEHLNINDVLLHNKLLSNLEDLIKLIDEKCNLMINGLKSADEEKRNCVRITTELTQKKIVEEIDGERSSQICQSEYNFKDFSNLNPFYQSSSNTFSKQTDVTNANNQQAAKPCQNDFGQQFNLSQENLGNKTQEKPISHVSKKVKHETILKETVPDIESSTVQEKVIESHLKIRRKESYEIEAEKEKERIDAEFRKEKERIEEELKKERDRLEDEARKQRLKLEDDARKERERIEEEMRKEKERLEKIKEMERQIEKDNELIRGLNEQMNKLIFQVDSSSPQRLAVDNLRNILGKLKNLLIQAKYIKDTQLNDKDKMNDFVNKINEVVFNVLALIESKIVNDLGNENFDTRKIDNPEPEIVNLDDNIKRIEYGFNLITNYVHCQQTFETTLNWIDETKEKINFLHYDTIENMIENYKKFSTDCCNEQEKLNETSDKLNSDLKYSTIVKTPYTNNLNELKSDFTDRCKEILDDFSNELQEKASGIEQQAKECDSFDEFKRVNQELNKLKRNNDPILDKIKQEPNLAIISDRKKIDNLLDELSKKLDNILDEKAVEFVHYDEFSLEPKDLKIDFVNLNDKSEHLIKIQNEIERYKELLMDNEIFLENLRKKLSEADSKPVEEAIKLCKTYLNANIPNQIKKLQSGSKDLNENLVELGCLQELKCEEPINKLNKLKLDCENKLKQLIGQLIELAQNNLDELKSDEKDNIKEIEAQMINLDELSEEFAAKVRKLDLIDNPEIKLIQNDLNAFKTKLNDNLEEKIKEEKLERLKKIEEERLEREKQEKERLKKLEEEKERLKKLEEEKERLKKLEEEERLEREKQEKERLKKLEEEKERLKKLEEEERLEREKQEKERLKKLEEEKERLDREKQEKERLKKLEVEERLEREKQEKERLKKLEEEKLERQRILDQENDFSSAANLSKIDEKDENDNINDKKLKKLNNKPLQEEPIAVVQIKMPQKSKAILTNASRMYSVEHYSELEDFTDGEPIIELVDSDQEAERIDNSILEEIREMLRDLKENQTDSSSLVNLLHELNNIKNICLKVDDVRNSKENSNHNLDDQLRLINGQLNDIFKVIKDILNNCIPNLNDNLSEKDEKNQSEQQLVDSIQLYTEVVTEFDKFDNLVNSNNEFMKEIKNQLRKINNKSLDDKLVDYRDLLDKINEQMSNVSNEISNMNENLQNLKYKENLDEHFTLDELEKLKKLCQDHLENTIEDLYISYIPKLNNLDNYLNQTTKLNELESILANMFELKEEINEKVNSLDLNGSPLIKNLFDLVEKLKNKIEAKIDQVCNSNKKQKRNKDDDIRDNLLNEQLEQTLIKQNKQALETELMINIEKTPDIQFEQAIFKQHHYNPIENQRTAQSKVPDSSSRRKSEPEEANKKLDEVLSKLKKLKDTLNSDQELIYDQIKNKMNDVIDLISIIQEIDKKRPDQAKMDRVTYELNQVIDCLSKVTNDYVKKVCKKENTKPDKLFADNYAKQNDDLDDLLNNLKPRFESITEFRKFEKLTETNQEKVDGLNRIIDDLTNLPINEKVARLKDCISNAEQFTNELKDDVNLINKALEKLKLINKLKPNITIEKYTEIKTTCRTDYNDLVKSLCKQAKSEINAFNRILNDAKNSSNLKELKKDVLNSLSQFEVQIVTADLANDLLVRETMNEYKNLNKKIDEKINRLIKEEKKKRSPFNEKIKHETKSHLIKSNSETLVGSSRIESINTGNELIKFLKEMVIKLDKLIKESNLTEEELKSYLMVVEEVCNQSNYVRENEIQLSEELNLIDKNLEIVRINLINLITKNMLDNLIDWNFELKSIDFELKEINFKDLQSNETNSKEILERLNADSNLIDEYNKLNKLMNETHEWIKDFECKLDYLPLRTLEELLDNYKATIFSVEILKARILDDVEMFNSRLEDCEFDAKLISNSIINELDILKERFEINCKELFDNFTKESMRKLNEYTKKCTNCTDRNEFQYMLSEVKEFDVMNTNRINKIIKSTQESLDKLLGKLKDANNNSTLDEQTESNAIDNNLRSDLSDSNNMIYVCDICIDIGKCVCVPKLEETQIPINRKKQNTRTKRHSSSSSSARNSWNITPEQLNELDAQERASLQNETSNGQNVQNNEQNEQQDKLLEEHLQFEIWLEAISGTIDFLLKEKKNLDENDFQEVALYLKKMQQLKHALKQNFNHPANGNKAIMNQYRMLYLTLEREVCLLKRKVENLRVGTPINLPIRDKEGRVVCQNGVHVSHFCKRFRRNFFTTAFKLTIPLQIILLTMFGISSLLPSNDDYRCAVTNSLRPTYGYSNQPPI